MRVVEKPNNEEDRYTPRVHGWQKIKLYKIKYFIFDFGGVMIEKTFTVNNIFEILEADLQITINRLEDRYYQKIKRRLSSGRISAREFLEKLFERYYYPYQKKYGALPVKKVNVDYYLELWFQLYSMLTNLSSEMEEIVHRLHTAGYTVSLLSNTFDIHAKSNELKGFFKIFDHVFLSNEIGYIKPDLEKYKYVLNKLDTKPKKCVFIDDKLRNLIPARQLGMLVIEFESIEKFKQNLKEMGIKQIPPNLREEIKNKYKVYRDSKKSYKKAKKAYKKAKKEYLKKKSKSLKRKKEYQEKYNEYRKKKKQYLKERKKKKKELEIKFKLD